MINKKKEASMMIKSGFACRLCRNQDPAATVHILANEGSGFQCERGHKFIDNEELLASNPLKVTLAKPAAKVQPGSVSFQLMLPSELRDRLQQRFGEKLSASAVALLGVMLDGDAFVVSGVDQLNVSKICGEPIKNSVALSSALGRFAVERDEAVKKCQELEKKTGGAALPAGACKVVLSDKILGTVKQKAQESGLPVPEYLASAIAIIFENGWL
jgi:hypothetical protein